MFQKIVSHLKHHWKIYTRITVVVAIALIITAFSYETTYAAPGDFNFEDGIAKVASYIIKLISMVIWIILGFIGMLLNNDFVVGKGMDVILHQIWLVVRNLVNVGFVFVLLGAAVYMVINPSGEGGIDIKKQLPTFVLAMVLVNFSWLGCRVILDVSSVLTSAVFAIPQSIPAKYAKCSIWIPDDKSEDGELKEITDTNCFDVASVKIDPNKGAAATKNQTTTTTGGKEKPVLTAKESEEDGQRVFTITWSDMVTTKLKELKNPGAFNSNNAVMIMAVNLASIQNMPLVASKIGNKSGLTINTIFSLAMIIIVIIPLIVLFIVLIGRMVILWLTICFMPLVFLGWVIKGSFTSSLFEGVPDVFEQFLNAAFLPVYVAMPISVGFLMINAGNIIRPYTDKGLGVPTLIFDPSIAGVGDIRQILWHIATVGVLWSSISIASSKGPEFTKSTVDFIGNKSKEWGSWIAKAPIKYIPFMPVGTGADGKAAPRYSLSSLFQLPDILKSRLDKQHGSDKAYELADKILPVGSADLRVPRKTLDQLNKFKNGTAGKAEQASYKTMMDDVMKEAGSTKDPKKIREILETKWNALGLGNFKDLSGEDLKGVFKKYHKNIYDKLGGEDYKWDDVISGKSGGGEPVKESGKNKPEVPLDWSKATKISDTSVQNAIKTAVPEITQTQVMKLNESSELSKVLELAKDPKKSADLATKVKEIIGAT